MLITKYKFDSTINTLPTFNAGFNYTYSDVDNGDGTITRTIESDTLPKTATFSGNGILHLYFFNTTELTTMANMFRQCEKLQYVDFSHFRGEKVTSMSYMLYRCYELVHVDFSNFNAISLKDMSYMFCFCNKLPSINFDNFNAQIVENLSRTFYTMNSIQYLDLSSFNGENLKITAYAFSGAYRWLDLRNFNINPSKITDSNLMFNGVNSVKKINFINCSPEAVSFMVNLLPARKETTKGYIFVRQECPNEKYWENVICKDETISISLPQPLNKIGEFKDKLYWDEDKGHYCIEQKICKITLNGSESWSEQSSLVTDICYMAYLPILNSGKFSGLTYLNDKFAILGSSYGEKLDKEGMYTAWGGLYINIFKSKLSSSNISGFKQWLSENPVTVLYVLEEPNIIDLPHLNKKYSFDATKPSFNLKCSNNPFQPSRMLLESDLTKYKPSTLETNTDYTIQFECKERSDKNIELNLGGSKIEVDAIVGTNHVSITTPNELSRDRLLLSGAGNKVDNVMIIKGEMNQYPEYFDGIQHTGILQGDGTYKIKLSSSNDGELPAEIFNGRYLAASGNLNATQGFRGDLFIDIDIFKKYNLLIHADQAVPGTLIAHFYNENKSLDTTIGTYQTLTKRNIGTNSIIKFSSKKEIPETVKYFRWSSNSNEENVVERYNIRGYLVSKDKEDDIAKPKTVFSQTISLTEPLEKGNKLSWNNENKRYEVDRNGQIEIPVITEDIMELPRLYQKQENNINIETGNIKCSNMIIKYKDID